MGSRLRKRLADGAAVVCGCAIGGLGAAAILEPDYAATAGRLARCAAVAAVMTTDYKLTLSLMRWQGLSAEQERAKLAAAHTRNATRLKAALFKNKGIYIKIGQHLGLLDYLLPPEYVSAMRSCFDCAPASPWSEVEQTLEEELGAPVDELFSSFDRVPLASASLAQVHRAVSRQEPGRELAVKVQHAGLQRMARTEITALERLLHMVRWVLPGADLQWMVDEAYFNLPRELDFLHEARNADRARAQVLQASFSASVVVPRTIADLSSARILTMVRSVYGLFPYNR